MICPLCGSDKGWAMRWNVDSAVQQWRMDHGDVRDYTWTLCQRCGNGYPSFQSDLELLSYIWNRDRQDAGANITQGDAVWSVRQAAARKGASRSFALFGPLSSGNPRRFLDIACGLGETVKYFADRGWDACGIDADPTVKRFHDRIGIKSEVGQIETATIEGKFDIIHIGHAIYFITNLRQFLGALHARLNDGGMLCIVLADFMASEDAGLPGYPHSFYPTASSMRYLLSVAGYRTVLCRRKSGSIYIAARPGAGRIPLALPGLIQIGYQTKALRYSMIGRPKLLLHRVAKALLSFAGCR